MTREKNKLIITAKERNNLEEIEEPFIVLSPDVCAAVLHTYYFKSHSFSSDPLNINVTQPLTAPATIPDMIYFCPHM